MCYATVRLLRRSKHSLLPTEYPCYSSYNLQFFIRGGMSTLLSILILIPWTRRCRKAHTIKKLIWRGNVWCFLISVEILNSSLPSSLPPPLSLYVRIEAISFSATHMIRSRKTKYRRVFQVLITLSQKVGQSSQRITLRCNIKWLNAEHSDRISKGASRQHTSSVDVLSAKITTCRCYLFMIRAAINLLPFYDIDVRTSYHLNCYVVSYGVII